MDYETFKEKFVEDLQDRLYEQGAEVNISVHTVNKLNESYEAVTVTPEGSNIGVNVGIDKFYDAMENGRSYDEVVDPEGMWIRMRETHIEIIFFHNLIWQFCMSAIPTTGKLWIPCQYKR